MLVVLLELKLKSTKACLRALESATPAKAAGDPLQEGEAPQDVTGFNSTDRSTSCERLRSKSTCRGTASRSWWTRRAQLDLRGIGLKHSALLAGVRPQPQRERSGAATAFRRVADCCSSLRRMKPSLYTGAARIAWQRSCAEQRAP